MKKILVCAALLIAQSSFANYLTCDFDNWKFRQNGKEVFYATECFLKTPSSNQFCRRVVGNAANVGPYARAQHIPYATFSRDSKETCESQVNVNIKQLKENYSYETRNIMGVKLYKFFLD